MEAGGGYCIRIAFLALTSRFKNNFSLLKCLRREKAGVAMRVQKHWGNVLEKRALLINSRIVQEDPTFEPSRRKPRALHITCLSVLLHKNYLLLPNMEFFKIFVKNLSSSCFCMLLHVTVLLAINLNFIENSNRDFNEGWQMGREVCWAHSAQHEPNTAQPSGVTRAVGTARPFFFLF